MKKKAMSYLASSSGIAPSLVCFPHAGGGTARYRCWHPDLSDKVHFLLPNLSGREGRFLEPACDSVERVVDEVVQELEPFGPSVILLGISYGALLAFETASRLSDAGIKVAGLLVASQRAPHQQSQMIDWKSMEEAVLMRKLIEIGGLEPSLVDDPEFCELFLSRIRTDLQASENYLAAGKQKLGCPIVVWHGDKDQLIKREDIEIWREVTSHEVSIRELPAGHFLMDGSRDLWLEDLKKVLHLLGIN